MALFPMTKTVLSIILLAAAVSSQLTSEEEAALQKLREEKVAEVLQTFDSNAIVTGERGIEMRVKRDQDLIVRRANVEETTLFKTREALDKLENSLIQRATDSFASLAINGITASVTSGVAATLAFVKPLINKTDFLGDAVSKQSATLSTSKNNIILSLEQTIVDFKTEITTSLDSFKTESTSSLQESLIQVNKSIDTTAKSMGKLLIDADNLVCKSDNKGLLRLKNDIVEKCDGSAWNDVSSPMTTTYVNWGTDDCKGKDKGVTTIYSGYAWGGHHDHRGGADPVCLKSGGGNNGAGADGNDNMNLLYPIHLTGSSPQNGNVQPNRLVRCAFCKAEKHCYLEMGVSGCSSSAYEPIYSGSTYGGNIGQVSGTSRICLDRSGKYDNGNNFGAYIYPTKVRSSFDGRSDNAFVHCHMCCEK